MPRTWMGLGLATLLLLGYVHQRVALVRLGYQVEQLRKVRDDFLDQRRVLDYNILTLQSPVILNRRLAAADVKLTAPRAVDVWEGGKGPSSAAVSAVSPSKATAGWFSKAQRWTSRWLEGGREAEAKPALGGE